MRSWPDDLAVADRALAAESAAQVDLTRDIIFRTAREPAPAAPSRSWMRCSERSAEADEAVRRTGVAAADAADAQHNFEVRLDGTSVKPLRRLPACLC